MCIWNDTQTKKLQKNSDPIDTLLLAHHHINDEGNRDGVIGGELRLEAT